MFWVGGFSIAGFGVNEVRWMSRGGGSEEGSYLRLIVFCITLESNKAKDG
jgi:hypothetical protein